MFFIDCLIFINIVLTFKKLIKNKSIGLNFTNKNNLLRLYNPAFLQP